MRSIDPTILAALVAAHHEGAIMPGGTLESAIAEVRRLIAATRRQLREATLAADEMFARGITPEQYGGSTGALATVEHRSDLLVDLERRRQHLAELEEAHVMVTYTEVRRVIGRLARGMALAS